MTLLSYTLRPSLRATLLTFLVHHNPFYLLSALCMLAGCYALNAGLAARPGDLGKLLALIGTLNAYELLLIGLGLYLIRGRGLVRDGRTLLLLEASFLVDLAFLNAEAGAVSFRAGLALNLCVAALAIVKVGVVLRVLWGRLPVGLFAFIAIELLTLMLMPSIFTWYDRHGGVTALQCYGWWWIVGGLLAAFELSFRVGRPMANPPSPLQVFMRRAYLTLPMLSLIGHLSMLHWVYRIDFTAGDLSPVLLGATFALGRSARSALPDVKRIRMLMPMIAVAMAIYFPPVSHVDALSRLTVSPAALTIAAAYVTYMYCFWIAWFAPCMAGGAIVGIMYLFGPTPQQIAFVLASAYRRVISVADRLVPRTAAEWGFAAVTGAFAFLALGAAVSLRKDPPPVEPAASVDVG